jgi:hypothetical protein
LYNKIAENKVFYPAYFSEKLQSLLKNIFIKNPADRMSLEQVFLAQQDTEPCLAHFLKEKTGQMNPAIDYP